MEAQAGAGHDVLDIRLQRPTVSYLILIDCGQKPFEISLRQVCIDERPVVGIERLRAL